MIRVMAMHDSNQVDSSRAV